MNLLRLGFLYLCFALVAIAVGFSAGIVLLSITPVNHCNYDNTETNEPIVLP